MVRRRGPRLTLAEKTELWRRWRRGESLNAIGRALGRIAHVVRYEVARTGGIPPPARQRSRLALTLTEGVGAQPFGCDEAAVGSLATVTAAGARSRHEIKGPSEVQDEGSRGEWVSVRAGLGPARERDAVALCRRHGRVAPVAVRSTRRAEDVLGLCDRDGGDAPPCLPGARAPSGRLLAVGLVVDGCRSRSPRPHHALPTKSVSRGCIPPHPIARTHPSHRRQHGTVDCGRRRMGCGAPRWTRPPRLEAAASCC